LFTSRLGSRRFARMIALKPSLLRKNNRRSCPKLCIVFVRLSICPESLSCRADQPLDWRLVLESAIGLGIGPNNSSRHRMHSSVPVGGFSSCDHPSIPFEYVCMRSQRGQSGWSPENCRRGHPSPHADFAFPRREPCTSRAEPVQSGDVACCPLLIACPDQYYTVN
jgi:hypothetical protein